MTRLSKWLLYIASYRWIYILHIASIVFSEMNSCKKTVSIAGKIMYAICSKKVIISILLVLFFLSGIIRRKFMNWEHNTRIKYQIDENTVFEIAFSVIAYFATVLTISLNTYGLLIVMAIFFVLGWVIDLTDSIYVPVFFMTGYRVYKAGKVGIITKMSRDQYRLKMDDAIDGIESRELVQNVYIIFD